MSERDRLESEKLVEIHQARDQWDGNLIIGYLRDNGIEASFQGDPAIPLDAAEFLKKSEEEYGVFVLEHEAPRARELVKEFLASRLDSTDLEREAMLKPTMDKQHFGELRQAVREERKTFEFLQWVVMIFLGALAMLWAIWPDWLKTTTPEPLYRWTAVVLLIVAALLVGSWTGRRVR